MAKEPPERNSGGEHPTEQIDEGTPASSAPRHDSTEESRTQAPHPEKQAGLLKPGDVLKGQFEIVRTLGRGGMGVVYEAQDRFLGERIALKTILPVHLSNKRAMERFIEEINVARSLNHPSIISVYDVAQDGGMLFFTMEFVEGDSLRRLLQKQGRFDLEDTVRIVRQLADALIYAHEYIVHRDLSPDNVMLLEDGTVKLLDFGLARMKARGTMTATGVALGKAYYMAPEQAKDASKVDARADIFSLGVMVFEMLSGELPSGFQRLSDLRPELPAACDALLSRCLAPVEKRFASAAEFKDALEKCVAEPAQALSLAPDGRGDKTKTASSLTLKKGRRTPVTLMTRIEAASPEWQAAAEGLRGFLDDESRRHRDEKPAGEDSIVDFLKPRVKSLAREIGVWARHAIGKMVRGKHRKWAQAALGLVAVACVLGAVFGVQLVIPSSDAPDQDRLKAVLQTHGTPGESRSVDLGGGVTLEMVWIPRGTFTMGSPSSEQDRADDEHQHQVTLTKGFWVGKYEVTQEQWERVMGSNPSYFKGAKNPVEQVSWEDAQAFCKKAGNGLRLPTEAEWEYACRAGSMAAYCFGDSESGLGDYAWYGSNNGSSTHPVGRKRANAWGLCDMHGNVLEWCQDWFGVYPDGSATDPRGPSSGSRRVIRGGSWSADPGSCRSAYRYYNTPVIRYCDLGFRLAVPAVQ